MQLTQAGEALYHQCHPLLASLQGALESTVSDTQQLHGELRITAPEDYSSGVLSDVVVAFSRLHPALHIELRSGDQVSDMVQEGIDLAFRLGWLKDSTLRARRLGTFQQYVVAAPSYLKRHGVPAHPKALETHDDITFTPLKAPLTWAFKQQETLVNVQMNARLAANSTVSLVALTAAGGGFSVLPDITAEPEIAAGRLARVLANGLCPRGVFMRFTRLDGMCPPKYVRLCTFFVSQNAALKVTAAIAVLIMLVSHTPPKTHPLRC